MDDDEHVVKGLPQLGRGTWQAQAGGVLPAPPAEHQPVGTPSREDVAALLAVARRVEKALVVGERGRQGTMRG